MVKRRKELGLTQEQLAQKMNVSPQAVSKWENSSYPDSELLPELAKNLDVSLDYLFGLKKDEGKTNISRLATKPDFRVIKTHLTAAAILGETRIRSL